MSSVFFFNDLMWISHDFKVDRVKIDGGGGGFCVQHRSIRVTIHLIITRVCVCWLLVRFLLVCLFIYVIFTSFFCFVFEISLFFLLFVNKLWLLDYVNKFHFGSIWNPHHRHQSKRKRWWKWKCNEKEKEKGLYPDIEIIYSFEENEKNLLIIVCVRQLTILCLINNHANIVVCLFVWFPWLIWRMFPNPKKKKKSLSSSLRLADNCLMMMIEWTISDIVHDWCRNSHGHVNFNTSNHTFHHHPHYHHPIRQMKIIFIVEFEKHENKNSWKQLRHLVWESKDFFVIIFF